MADYGADSTFGVDCAPLLEQAIADIVAAGGGRLMIEPGHYRIARAPVGMANAQVPLPTVASSTSQPTVVLRGALPPPTSGTGALLGGQHTVLESTYVGVVNDAAMVASGPPGTRNHLHLVVRDLVTRMPPNPTLTAWNLAWQQDCEIHNLYIDTGNTDPSLSNVTQPTHPGTYGVILPQYNNSAFVRVDGLHVWGYYTGIKMGELGLFRGWFQSCYIAAELPFAYHQNEVQHIGIYECPYGLVSTGNGDSYTEFWSVDFENANNRYQTWMNTAAHVVDPTNNLRGVFRWHAVDANVGVSHDLIVQGGANIELVEKGARGTQPPPPPPTPAGYDVIYDTFTDVDWVPLPTHTIAPTNVPSTYWFAREGEFEIVGNAGRSRNGIAVASVNTNSSDVAVSTLLSRSGPTEGGLIIRALDTINYWLVDFHHTEGIKLYQVLNGTYLLQASAPAIFNANTAYELKAVNVGTTITIYIDNIARLTFDSPLMQTNTSQGLWAINTALTFDGFRVTLIPKSINPVKA